MSVLLEVAKSEVGDGEEQATIVQVGGCIDGCVYVYCRGCVRSCN